MLWKLILCLILVCAFVSWLYFRIRSTTNINCQFKMSFGHLRVKAGDIVLTSDHNILTRLLGQSTWNHIGMIYEHPLNGVKYVWEVQIPPIGYLKAFVLNSSYPATRLVPWHNYYNRYKKTRYIVIRQLNQPVDVHRFHQVILEKWSHTFAFEYLTYGMSRFFQDWFSLPSTHRQFRRQRYCAEIVADTLSALGVFDKQQSDHKLLPCDFAEQSEQLPWHKNFRFGPEILIVD